MGTKMGSYRFFPCLCGVRPQAECCFQTGFLKVAEADSPRGVYQCLLGIPRFFPTLQLLPIGQACIWEAWRAEKDQGVHRSLEDPSLVLLTISSS